MQSLLNYQKNKGINLLYYKLQVRSSNISSTFSKFLFRFNKNFSIRINFNRQGRLMVYLKDFAFFLVAPSPTHRRWGEASKLWFKVLAMLGFICACKLSWCFKLMSTVSWRGRDVRLINSFFKLLLNLLLFIYLDISIIKLAPSSDKCHPHPSPSPLGAVAKLGACFAPYGSKGACAF